MATVHTPLLGLVEVTTFWSLSSATQSELDGHETDSSVFVPSASTAVQVAVVGCVDVAIVPPPPTATQREAEGQDTLVKLFAPILNWLHADAPPLGLVDRHGPRHAHRHAE